MPSQPEREPEPYVDYGTMRALMAAIVSAPLVDAAVRMSHRSERSPRETIIQLQQVALLAVSYTDALLIQLEGDPPSH